MTASAEPGRHHLVIPGDIISYRPGDFVGIRSYVNCEARVPKDDPLRAILRIVDAALAALSPKFEGLYAKFGRPSIPPERLLRALLLQAFYWVRSETQLMEQLQYNLLFRGLSGCRWMTRFGTRRCSPKTASA
jgi:transposase